MFGTVVRVTIEVFNPVAPGDPGVERLMSTVRWLDQMDDPKGAFLARLGELAQSSDDGESGIGLARIAYEGDCTLDASVDNGIVRVCATSRP